MKNVEDILALAPLQQLMLMHALSNPGSELLVEQFSCTLTGALDTEAFARAWRVVVGRHALLRTAMAWEGLKKPVQLVRRDVELPCTTLDAREMPAAQRQRRCETLAAKDRRRGFDLAKAPLARLSLLRLADDQWFFVWTCHHLIADGWCLGVVLREVFACYEQLRAGREPLLPPAGAFRDYQAWLAARDPLEAERYWRGALAGAQPMPSLPIERSQSERLATPAGHGQCELQLTPAESAALNQVAMNERVSQSNLVQAAWAVLLSRYFEQEHVTFGITVAGRPPQVAGIETIVGPLVNNVPLSVRLGRDETLSEVCQRLQRQQTEMQPYEYCPIDEITRAAGIAGGRRLFDTLVVYENYPLQNVGRQQVGSLLLSDIHGTATSNYALTLVALPGETLSLRLLYDQRRYEPATAARLLDQVATILRGMIEQPGARIRELSLSDNMPAAPQLQVLDFVGQLAPVGLPGSLFIVEKVKYSGRLASVAPSCLQPTRYRALLQADGTLEFLGPAVATVRIGAQAIVPTEIRAVLILHPLVRESVVVGYTDAAGDVQLAAYVVPAVSARVAIDSGQHGLLLGQLRKFLEERLPAPCVPTVWRAVDELPRDAQGQVDVTALAPPIRPRGEGPVPYAAPSDELETRLASIWSEVLGVEPVGIHDSFLDLGGYSSLAVTLLARLEAEFGRGLPLASMFEEPTVAHLAKLLRRGPSTPEEISLVPIRASGTQPPLFCVHPAGGTVFCYLELAKHLRADVPIYGLQAQGIDGTLAPHTTVPAMAAHYVRAIKTIQAAGPYRVGGWSTGGIVAFEVARQLRSLGDEVSLVALFDSAIPRPDQSYDETDVVPMLALMFPGEDPERLAELSDLSTAEQVEFFRSRAEMAQLLIAGSAAAQARRIYDVFQANMQAVVDYQPQPIDCRLLLVRASDQATPMHADALLGWGPWTGGGVEVREVPGLHLEMFQGAAVVRLAEVLDEFLAPVEALTGVG